MIIDGCLQVFYNIESTSFRRALTGGLFGFACGGMVSYIYDLIDYRSL
jgi:hypothetical protein